MTKAKNPVVKYYRSVESRLGYHFVLGGVKHFGYYPAGQEHISKAEAQILMNDQLADALNISTSSHILDAGCGEGGVALYLAEKYGANVTGVDLLDFDIKKARKSARERKLSNKVKFFVADYANTDLPDVSFDAIFTMETLVHAPDYHKALREFHRLLKPNGRLILFEYSLSPEDKMPDDAAKAFERVNRI